MYRSRYLEKVISRLTKTFKVLFVGGPRQVGKTTLLLHLAEKHKIHYVTLDDLNQRRLAQNDPELFLQQYPTPLFIDEVQYAPQLFPYIKIRVDQSQKQGLYWLTGSQQFSLLKNIQESLAGRVGIVHLLGFSSAEIRNLSFLKSPFLPGQTRKLHIPTNLREIFEWIWRGSFPRLWHRPRPSLEPFYSSYVQTYMDRDLRELFGVEKISEFHRFLELCAARTGQMLNTSELARDAGISVHAAREWLNILESTLHIYLLQPYHSNFSKRLIKSPKLYFLDTGLAAYLTRWKTAEALRSGAMAGAFFETFVVSELIKSYLFRGEIPPFYYFRDKEGHEIDLLIERNQKLYPIEIKLASSVKSDHLKSIRYLRAKFPQVVQGALLTLSPDPFWIDPQNEVVPVGFLQ